MTAVYVRVIKSFNMTTGAFKSQNYMASLFENRDIPNKNVLVTPIKNWVKYFISGKAWNDDYVRLIAVNYYTGTYHKFIRLINAILFNYWLKQKEKVSTIIIDGMIPVSELPKSYKYVSFVRSSPQCLVYSAMDGRRDFLLHKQLKSSSAVVCASPDAFDAWKAFGNLSSKAYFSLPVPISNLLSSNQEEPKSVVDDFIQDAEILSILIFAGNIGPRKGLIPLFDELDKLDPSKFRVCIFGKYSKDQFDYYDQYRFKIDFLGFQQCNFLAPSRKNVLRVYPAISECMSRIHLEGIFSGDTVAIYRRGLEPKLSDWIGDSYIFNSYNEVIQIIESNNYSFCTSVPEKEFEEQYKALFWEQFDRLVNYAKEI